MRSVWTIALPMTVLVAGCMPNVDFSEIQKPPMAAEMAQYKVFVGDWAWEAERLSGEGEAVEKWTGTAEWDWALGGTYLHGSMTSKGPDKSFSSEGYWGWHPEQRKYVWWLLNDWGYPQQGTARHDAATGEWTMKYKGVGLDGTASYGCYSMRAVNQDNLEWTMNEWADALHTIKKIEMRGSYKRR